MSLRPFRCLMPGKSLKYVNCKLSFSPKMDKNAKNVEFFFLKVALHLLHSNSFLQIFFLNFYISSCRGRTTSKKEKLMNLALKCLSHEPTGPNISSKIKSYILSRAKLLCSLCHEVPCTIARHSTHNDVKLIRKSHMKIYDFMKTVQNLQST